MTKKKSVGQPPVLITPVRNVALGQKMDALAWLARHSEFVSEGLALKMVQVFRETEVPLRDMETRRRYKHQVTESNAIISVCQQVRDTLAGRETLPQDVASLLRDARDVGKYILNRLRVPIQIIELLICNQENALNALRNSHLIKSLNEIFEEFGLKDNYSGPESTMLVKLSARILATVMNHGEAKFQFIEESVMPLVNLMSLMAQNSVFDTSTQTGVVDQIEFVANGLKVVRLLTSNTTYTAKIQSDFVDFISIVGGLLSSYFENSVIQSEGRAILQNYLKISSLQEV